MKGLIIFTFSAFALVSCVQNTGTDNSISLSDIDSSEVLVDTSSTSSSLGIWSISNYVDEFGEPSKMEFIMGMTQGTFSNSATENSELDVKFLIDSRSEISIQLYEYAGDNPVKSGISENYRIKIKSADGSTATLSAYNGSDRLVLDKKDSRTLSSFLLKGGSLAFYIVNLSEYTSSSYRFEITDTSGFDEALKLLSENKKLKKA
ncbi:hypothetical protein [Alistipes sp. ZOR0009]|uniref:hypothetical protein n=1 Tax=Alistipes sp. ZOR0009 TaxID=1339253 RepID=UPI000646EBCC|nr:hypothetical protein [Alistipes sp. ZOR0009]